MQKLQKFIIGYPLIILLFIIGLTSSVAAVNTTFSQKILPLDCIFTTINAGTGELYYVTPVACGVAVTQPPQTLPNKSTTNNTGQPAVTNSRPFQAFTSADVISNPGNINSNNYQSWQPLTPSHKQSLARNPPPKSLGTTVLLELVIVLFGILLLLGLRIRALMKALR